ncbi:response regulator [Argonema antarcticum]|uniref:response regulator n=1 Tax=Argonema antarcticum TaxID=2942763 RepID=UPI002012064B|nr:response regulator [Argonema antarcticum]MCL1473067.1 response regulator [Argonema antarcticum A004/B2]
MNIKRVLIVDDEYRIREVTKIALEMMAGWEVLTASSGKEGLLQAQVQQPDAILLDVMMPDMDGTATLVALQANNATRDIPVVLLSAKVQVNDRSQFAELGVKAIIPKPFDPLNLAIQIAEALGW